MRKTGVQFRIHAVQRMFERDISLRSVIRAVASGETIEDYSDEMPEPARLVLGYQGRRPFHVVVANNLETNGNTVITVYVPTQESWKKDFKTRRL